MTKRNSSELNDLLEDFTQNNETPTNLIKNTKYYRPTTLISRYVI